MLEAEWQRIVVQTARLMRWREYHTYDSRRSNQGFPDLTLVRPPRLIFTELKGERTPVTPEQAEWLRLLALVPGVETYLWRPRDWPQVQRVLGWHYDPRTA